MLSTCNTLIDNDNMTEQTDKMSLLKKLEQRHAALERKLQMTRSKIKEEERKKDTRRKILIGAMILAKAQQSTEEWDALVQELDRYLTADRERYLFGLRRGADISTPLARPDAP